MHLYDSDCLALTLLTGRQNPINTHLSGLLFVRLSFLNVHVCRARQGVLDKILSFTSYATHQIFPEKRRKVDVQCQEVGQLPVGLKSGGCKSD